MASTICLDQTFDRPVARRVDAPAARVDRRAVACLFETRNLANRHAVAEFCAVAPASSTPATGVSMPTTIWSHVSATGLEFGLTKKYHQRPESPPSG